MANNLLSILDLWYPLRDARGWVIGSVYQTEGSAYRKPGAFMLFDDQGGQFGLLSGGCLESDIHRAALAALGSGSARTLRYDSSDEDEMTFQLGLGCGGIVDILLQPVTAAAGYLGLPLLRERLAARAPSSFWQKIPADNGEAPVARVEEASWPARSSRRPARLVDVAGERWLCSTVLPEPHLLVVGGGIDARPLAAMARTLGWELTVLDPRPANARPEHFPGATRLSRAAPAQMAAEPWFDSCTAAVIMTHSKQLDAQALQGLQHKVLTYCAMIGPPHRQREVMALAGLQNVKLPFTLRGPAGLDLGGDRPESVALSILSQCHAALHEKSAGDLASCWPATGPAPGSQSALK